MSSHAVSTTLPSFCQNILKLYGASHIIDSDRLAQLMYHTALNDLKRPKQPETMILSPWEYAMHVKQVYKFTFETPGDFALNSFTLCYFQLTTGIGRIQDCGKNS